MITCSSVASGWTWDWPALAFFNSSMSSRETVMCIRLRVAVIGSTWVRGGGGGGGGAGARVPIGGASDSPG